MQNVLTDYVCMLGSINSTLAGHFSALQIVILKRQRRIVSAL